MRSEALGASSSAAYASEGRGAGGKLRRPFARKPPSTPYDRPLAQQRRSAETGVGGGWMSKIVNPAYRLIAGGAARLLPSVFSSSSADSLPAALPPPEAAEEGLEQGTRNENQESLIHLCMSKSSAAEGPCEQEGPDVSKAAGVGPDKSQHLAGDPDLSNIEQLIKGKTFCREEIDHLMGILLSRVVDAEGRGLTSNVDTTEKADKVEIPHGNLKSENEEKQENLDEDRLANLTPLQQPTANEEIGASPVELAKAYMGCRTSEFATRSISQVPKNDRLLSHTYELPSNRFLPPPSPKPSICWPGAIVHEQHGYLTPHSQRDRYGLSNHHRTPYSRTIYSRSKPKLTPLQADSRKLSDVLATPIQKQTPLYGESRIRAAEDVQGSVGPIRRLRNKFVSETPRRASPSLWSSQEVSPQVKESFLGDNSLAIKPIEPTAIGTSFQSSEHKGLSDGGTSVVHPHTSKLACQILEQISRTPTPKDKYEELKLVISKKNYSTSEVSVTANDGFLPDKEKKSPYIKVSFANLPTGGIDGTDNDSTSASKTIQKSSFSFLNIKPSTTNLVSTQAIEIPHPRGPVAATNLPLAGAENVQKAPTPSGAKPVLPLIFIDKSNHRVRFASENCGTGFTFPVAASSSSSEPPTPSMMPFSSPTLNPLRDVAKPLTYAFGEKKSAPTPVFSFPSTSNASDTPLFKFGSEGSRVSFSSIGKDAVCC